MSTSVPDGGRRSRWSTLMRRKQIPHENNNTGLERVLTTFHMSLLGVGSTLGLGVYVLTGKIAARSSGPSVVLAFAIAAVASFLSGICYAEFGARVPRAGSAYVYSYVTVGELMAFVIGWNLVLEYVIGAASVARGYSVYIDSLFDGVISSKLREIAPLNLDNFSKYPDFLAFSIMALLTVMVIVGVKESTRFNSLFTCVNIVIVLYVIICGSFKADFHNWNLSKDEVPHRPPGIKKGDAPDGGEGGFFPFGFAGLMEGASTCFYAFVGFDIIATSAEEAINPTRTIPLSILISLSIVFFAYVGVSGVVTLMWPYWDLLNDAPLPYVFTKVRWPVAKWVVTIGGLAGLSTSLLGAIFPLPRVLYAMARDGLLFDFFAYVHPKLKTPIYSTMFGGALAAVLSLVFDIDQLADMMSIGTLMAYSLAAISVVLLRFRDDADDDEGCKSLRNANNSLDASLSEALNNNFTAYVWNSDGARIPNKITSQLSTVLITLICLMIFLADLSLFAATKALNEYAPLFFATTALFATLAVCMMTLLSRQPRSPKKLSFKVPLVPWIPLLSVAVNFYLMMNLPLATWKRFIIWMAIGFLIYFGYGYWESTGYMSEEQRQIHLTRKRMRESKRSDDSALEITTQSNSTNSTDNQMFH